MTGGLRPLTARYRLVISLALLAVIASVYIIQTGTSITASPTTGPTEVAIITTASTYPSETEIQQMVRNAVTAAGGLDGIIQPGDKVVVHPNIVNTMYTSGQSTSTGAVTDYRVTREVVRIAQELTGPTGSVVIGEGTATYRDDEGDGARFPTAKAFHDAGYDSNWDKIDDATGAALVDFNDVGQTWPEYPDYSGPYPSTYVTKKIVTDNLLKTEYWLNNTLVNADVVIKVPVMKNHELAGITGSLKLAVGTAPNDIYHYYGPYYKVALLHNTVHGYSSEYENNARAIVDLNRCKPADFVVMDAINCVTNGPVGHGSPINKTWVGCILAGKDMVAVDTIETLIMSYAPSSVRHLVLASSSPALLGTMDVSQITIKGAHVADVKKRVCDLDPSDYVGAAPAESTSPTITAVYPGNGTMVSGTVSVSAEGVTDNSGDANLLRAELYVDGNYVGTDTILEGSKYSIPWDSKTVADGSHQLKIYVYDKFLNENGFGSPIAKGGTTVTVTVKNTGNAVANAFSQNDGYPVSLGQLIITAPSSGGYFYAELADRSMGLKVKSSGSYIEGNLISIAGYTAGANAERYVDARSIGILNPSVQLPAPFAMSNIALGGVALNAKTPGVTSGYGPYNLGLLVKTWGKVMVTGSDFFYITDGSKLPDGSAAMVYVKASGLAIPPYGEYISVTGISIPVNGQPASRGLLTRKQTDIVSYPH